MASSFEDRKKGFESAFAHDAALQFRATARRNKMLGLWAAEKMKLSEEEADAYARSVIKADLEEPGDDVVVRKLRADFDAHGVDCSDEEVRLMMVDFMEQAIVASKDS